MDSKKTEIELEHYLKDLCTTLFLEKNQLSLGLSGGLDSRLLLSVLSGNPEIEFDLYTFSGIKHPDEEVARNLSNLVRKPHQFLNYSWENFSLDELAIQTSRSMLNSTIPHVLFNQLYAKLGAENVYSIDGGIGEIGRRRYFRGLQLRAEKAIQSRDISTLAPFFNSPKADIFNDEINQQMKLGFHQRLEYAINSMPTYPTIGNWLDLFSIRTRLLNIAGLNQEHVDSTHFHIMPFVQPDFLNAILSLPESERLNAKWYRKLIKKHLPSSSKLPLVKTDDVYPFWMKDISSQVWIKLQKRSRKKYQNPLLVNVFLSNESQIRDILSLSSLHQIDFYDPQKVNYLVHSFYDNNNYQLAASLNWFLTFELFRKKLAHESI